VKRDFVTSERILEQLREQHRDSRFLHRRLTHILAGEYQKQGRLTDARRLVGELMAIADAEKNGPDHLRFAIDLGAIGLRYGEPASTALAPVAASLARYPLETMAPLDRPYPRLIRVYAGGGRREEASRLLREYHATVPEGYRRGDELHSVAEGAVAEAEGRDDDALAIYREMYRTDGDCGVCGLFEIAGIHERQDRPDSALAIYQYLVDHPSPLAALQIERYTLAPSYKRLGELYEAKGDRRRAADYYGRFVDLWKNADAQLQPSVREARGRLAQLARDADS
jgi:tetratricopeptide (TPR) repeat protein